MKFENIRQLAQDYKLILASGSPRRFDLLTELGISFERVIPQIDEDHNGQEAPYDYAERLACEKAVSVSENEEANAIVIGCDTVVVLNGQILAKPTDKDDAFRILSLLSGKNHVVCTAAALSSGKTVLKSGYELTEVFFNKVSSEAVKDYISTGESMDKAGAYGIQGMGAFLVDRIEGNLDNVIGLPRILLDDFAGEIIKNSSEK